MTRILCAIALTLLVAGTALGNGDDGKIQAVRDALAAGRPVVLALSSKLPSPDAEGEAYADWAAYLNDFAAAHGNYAVVAMERVEAEQLLAAPPLENGYATIFIRSGGAALIYDGPILEPFVYDAAVAFLNAPADDSYDAELFAPFDLKLH